MSTPTLTPTQSLILTTAIQNHGGKLLWFPDKLKGGAFRKVIGSLWQNGLIEEVDDAWRVTAAGYEALGQTPPESEGATHEQADANPETDAPAPAQVKPRRSRKNTKQATVIALLQRPEGATLDQLVAATGWMKHTVRGCLAGALKKKLGMTVTSAKGEEGERVYRVA